LYDAPFFFCDLANFSNGKDAGLLANRGGDGLAEESCDEFFRSRGERIAVTVIGDDEISLAVHGKDWILERKQRISPLDMVLRRLEDGPAHVLAVRWLSR
jgi:hypothetical protein